MPLERADIMIKDGEEEGFTVLLKEKVLPLLAGVPGVKSVRSGRGVENPDKFMLLVDWESLAAHTAFKEGPVYLPFVKLFGSLSKGGAMEHFEMLD